MRAISSRQSFGFSLIEVMLSVVIGMIATLAILEMVADSEKGKRMIARGADTQTNGLVALQMLQKDVRMSGWLFSGFDLLGCQVTLPSGSVLNALAPVTINPAGIPPGDPNTDVLMVAYGNGDGAPLGLIIQGNSAANPNAFVVADPPLEFNVGDYVIPTLFPCANIGSLTLGRVVSLPADAEFNVETDNWNAGFVIGTLTGTLYNLGSAPKINVYAVRNSKLTVCDFMTQQCDEPSLTGVSSVWQPVIDDVVSLRAQYGRDTTPPPVLNPANTFQAGPENINTVYDQTTPATVCDWARAPAVRFAIMVRTRNTKKMSEKLDDNDPTNDYDVWIDTDNMVNSKLVWAGSAGAPLDLSANPDWKKYRYQVFETVVALRNIRMMPMTLYGRPQPC
jgi:type IV pilus assembly protein PilW